MVRHEKSIRVAAERCTTAKEAVLLIGMLIETYGYYGTGELLPIADPEEGWVMEMAPSPEGTGGLWVAKKVPDGKEPGNVQSPYSGGYSYVCQARELLSTYSRNQANQVVDEWWDFAWSLVAKYDDGYINAPGKMAQEVGYPDEWYEKSKWPQGPTSYSKPEKRENE